jgi:hypothetical protein
MYSFALLPFYTLLAFLTFGKPYNYGEHLVINAYIQGLSMMVLAFIFLICLFTVPSLYNFSIILTIVYYPYAYARLYKLSLLQSLLRTLKFLLILTVFLIVFIVTAGFVGYLLGRFGLIELG